MSKTTVILDTNISVSTGFNAHSDSARIIEQVREGQLRMTWTEATRAETRHILKKIPPLSWGDFSDLFRDEARYDGAIHPERYAFAPDPADRKFLALAVAVEGVLISHDDDLLAYDDDIDLPILTPERFLE